MPTIEQILVQTYDVFVL